MYISITIVRMQYVENGNLVKFKDIYVRSVIGVGHYLN